MALRLPIKINRNFIQNLGKVFYSGKPTTKPVCNVSEANLAKTATKDGNLAKNSIYGSHVSSLVEQVQISSEEKVSEADILQMSIEKNHLQPSMLPEYYKPPTDISSGAFPKLEDCELQAKGVPEYRTFEKSSTYKKVKLPLKKPKLVSPFPDPVKVMPSDTVSDLEKADIKEAEARCGKSDSKIPTNFTQCRYYSKKSKGSDKCKKVGKKKKACVSAKTPCKSPAKKKICEDIYKFKKCKKKKAPYQAYSEFCHTIPDEKLKECKTCPWKPTEHPTFKPPKKKFHTSSIRFSPKKRLHEKQKVKSDYQKGWVALEKWRCCLIESIHEEHLNPLQCKKSPCKPPKGPCGKSGKKKKNKKNKKGKKKHKKNKKGKKKHKKGNMPPCPKPKRPKKKCSVNSNKSWVTLVDPESVQELPTLFNHRTVPNYFKTAKDKERGSGNLKKFPFRGCNIKKPKKNDAKSKCRKTRVRKRRGVEDCPPDKCKKSSPLMHPSFEYLLGKSKKPKCPKCPKISPGKCEFKCSGCDIENPQSSTGGTPSTTKTNQTLLMSLNSLDILTKSKKSKCPTVETDKCQKKDDDDPCGLKRKGKTKECPKDLLKKKRHKPAKPRKKTEGAYYTPLSILSGYSDQYILPSNLAQPIPSTSSQCYF